MKVIANMLHVLYWIYYDANIDNLQSLQKN